MKEENMEVKDKEIYGQTIKARGRRYYFDIKENRNGDRYVTISETQPKNNQFKRMRIMVFGEYLDDFIVGLQDLKSKINISEEEGTRLVAELKKSQTQQDDQKLTK